jgi:predicted nucleic acid-binding protein
VLPRMGKADACEIRRLIEDGMFAATARVHGLSVATRKTFTNSKCQRLILVVLPR